MGKISKKLWKIIKRHQYSYGCGLDPIEKYVFGSRKCEIWLFSLFY